jgi:riboflavin kinase/FMN adenylyltransferase
MKEIESIAIGGFDGMHIGHQALFRELGRKGGIVAIETGYANLTPNGYRERYTDYPIFYLQLQDIRHLEGSEFVSFLKQKFPKLRKIVVGYDFHFGKQRRYSFSDLQSLFDGEVVVVSEVKYRGESVHSHKIRQKLSVGDIEGANAFLGHNYMIVGNKEAGQGLGSRELVATININAREFLMPKEGVYVTLTRVDDEEHFHPSVSFIGHRISTDGTFAVESHILDGTVYCERKAEISFVAYLRENRKFDSLVALKEAIQKDIVQANRVLKRLQL